ncbi:hypothetical protein M8C21_013832 [Ambrosia artemisiifolia]|uniref:Uncharacterized protein n=1 Tax=Ambrosia artemisiifolia TaxID=4212 RepID=A0AAD5CPH5_AMBAR|nr:hypothetical protein M8C21_013832 [Ambrosia artemisiifolia]
MWVGKLIFERVIHLTSYMDYGHLVTKEGARESLIAISYGVVEEIDGCLPETENANGVTNVAITNTRNKTLEELRSELISLASFEPSSGKSTTKV